MRLNLIKTESEGRDIHESLREAIGSMNGSYTHLTIYTDGASRGNPGPAASGIHIVDDTTSETVVDLRVALGIATNNVAEYQAVLHAVKWLVAHKELLADDIQIRFRLDSILVVSQLSGLWKINDPYLQQLAGEVREHLRQLPGTHTFEYIPREENKDADRLANDALDKGGEHRGRPSMNQIDITIDKVCTTCRTKTPLRYGTELVTLQEHTTIETRVDPDEFLPCLTCGNPLRLRIRTQPYELVNHLDTPPARALYEQQLRDETDNAQ